MRIFVKRLPRRTAPTFIEFLAQHDLLLRIEEIAESRWHARIDGAEVKDGAILESVYGSGTTPARAVYHYEARIAGCLLVVGAMQPVRREIVADFRMSTLEELHRALTAAGLTD